MVTMNCDLCEARGVELQKARALLSELLGCLATGVVLTVGNEPIDHGELNLLVRRVQIFLK